ncbi:MAG: efflux RND transporter permease subunit, partial [Desulfobacterales bacterium]|nr:efflux RND transporter permease subunit [Desulfobacterales bacterium]
LAVETGIVMLVYLDEAFNRKKGQNRLNSAADLYDAVTEGAVKRVRPLIMTEATTLIGLLPIMYGSGAGSQIMKRIAAPMVGGLVSSTVMILIIIPILYSIWKMWRLERKQ